VLAVSLVMLSAYGCGRIGYDQITKEAPGPCVPSSNVQGCDGDKDGSDGDVDPDNSDPCVPFTAVAVCDADGDGSGGDVDPDNGNPCVPSTLVAACDADGDGSGGDVDPDNGDPCVPSTLVAACDAVEVFLKASNTGVDDQFGYSVSVSADGKVLAVGAIWEDSSGIGVGTTPDEGASKSGAVYVYTRSGGNWIFEAFLKASNTGANDQFGRSVSLSADGNTLAVGALYEDSSGTGVGSTPDEGASDSGAVYVYTRSGGNWIVEAFLKASNTGADDQFGSSVSLSANGNTLAVGADLEASSGTGVGSTPDEGAFGSGAVYVYTRSGGIWIFEAFLKASNAGALDYFGYSVSLSADGNTLAVGANNEASSGTGVGSTPDEGTQDSGAVYVYTRSGGAWTFEAFLKASNTGVFDYFGYSVSLSADGNTLAVGAILEDSSGTGVGSTPDEGASGSGAVYVYTRSGGNWVFEAFVKASNTGVNDQFGRSVSLSADGNTLAVSALSEDSSGTGVGSTPDEGASDSGAVYVYTRSGGAWIFEDFVKAGNTGASDKFGSAVSLSADGNTLAVGADFEASSGTGVGSTPDEGASDSGAVYVYRL
jgi:hypothetical protein